LHTADGYMVADIAGRYLSCISYRHCERSVQSHEIAKLRSQ
jgi:hypothetical protein